MSLLIISSLSWRIVWLNTQPFIGTIGLLICMFGGVMYQKYSTSNKPKAKHVGLWSLRVISLTVN
jgi:hypothetical protein